MKQDPIQAAFSHLIISGTLVHEAKFSDLQHKYGVTVHPHLVMVVSIDRYPDLANGKSIEWRQEVGHQLVDAIDKTVTVPFTWIWVEEGVLALLIEIVASQSAANNINQRMVRMAKSIQKSLVSDNISVSMGIGTYYDNPYLVHQSYREAIKSMSGRFFQGNQLIFQFGKEVHAGEVWDDPLSTDKTETLALVRMGDEQGVVSHLRKLLGKMADTCQYNEDMFKSEVVDLVIMMSRAVVEAGVSATAILSKNVHFINELYTTIRYDKFVQKVLDYGQWLTAQVGQAQMPNASPIIRQVIRYIKQNHLNSISLEEVARYCCLSRYHLSHLFKKEIGVGVIDYLNQIRVEKAAFYAQTTDLPIQQIANQVGFQDANYFSRMFKKYTGRSPREFRTAKSS